jgi:hypothetical protein
MYICKQEKKAIELIERANKETNRTNKKRLLTKADKIFANLNEINELKKEGLK